MKTNLDSLFKTDKTAEQSGEWYSVAPGVRFLLARLGGANAEKLKKVHSFHFKPLARRLRSGEMTQDEEHNALAKVFVEAVLLDWEGLTDMDGSELPFTKENAVEILTELPELLGQLSAFSEDVDNYKGDLGNS